MKNFSLSYFSSARLTGFGFIGFILTMLFLALTSCETSSVDLEPDPIVKPPVVTFKVNIAKDDNLTIIPNGSTEVIAGSDLPISVVAPFGIKIDSVKINGISLVFNGGTYNLVNIRADKNVRFISHKTMSYTVAGSLNPWHEDTVYIFGIYDSTLVEGWAKYNIVSQNDFAYFYPTGRYDFFHNGSKVGDGAWSVDETKSPAVFNFGGSLFGILELTSTRMVWLHNGGKIKRVFSRKI